MTTAAVTIVVPVAWGDMDAFGHVNNVVYLRWFESCRIAFFEQVAIAHSDVSRSHAPILARTSCNFVRALAYPDTVRVHTSLRVIGTKSFTMVYRVESQQLNATAAEGDGTVVWYDYAAHASIPIPDDLRNRLAPFCATPEVKA